MSCDRKMLDEFYDYKDKLMEDLLTDKTISSLIADDEDIQVPAKELAYSNVFPFEYLPDTIEDAKTFVCFDVDIQRSVNKTYLLPVIYIWIFAHKSKMRLPKGGVRVDKLASEIADKISGSRFYGLGELEFHSSKRFAPLSDYNGKMLVFHAKDFNNIRPTGKEIPSNRKIR